MTHSIDSLTTPAGVVKLISMTNSRGATVTLSTLGAGIVEMVVPDRAGNLADVVLGYHNPADYLNDGPCAGKIPGRYANRIARGLFTIDGIDYRLRVNNGPNALHGGPTGFQNRVWDVDTSRADRGCVVFSRVSDDGEEGYPGTLRVKATYTLSDDENTLTLQLEAVTDSPTIINLTNHSYWNLDGEEAGSVLDHKLKLNATAYAPTDDTLVPLGEIAPVEGTPMDFTAFHPLGERISVDFPALKYGKGYDNCWIIDRDTEGQLVEAARLVSEKSGRELTVLTTQPAVQIYTGNWLAGSPVAKCGRPYNDYDGVAIECQNIPDAPNHPNFPNAVLRQGEKYEQTIQFKFTTLE